MAASLDEAYLNMTSYIQEHQLDPTEAVSQLRAEIFEKTKITTSAGLGASTFPHNPTNSDTLLAKIGSNKNKVLQFYIVLTKPNNQFILPNDRQTIMQFMKTLPCRKINGIGKVFERILADALGIHTVADIYEKRCTLYKLLSEKSFDFLISVYLGIGATSVGSEDYERKSVGCERTFRDEGNQDKLREILRGIADELAGDLERAQTAVYCD
jgi:DNA polymerase kappa